jgi:excisionase family DNA binding protein
MPSATPYRGEDRLALLRARCSAAERTATELAEHVRHLSREVTELAERPAVRPKAVSVDVAAHLLSLSRTSLYELLDAGRIRSVKVGTRRLIPSAALDDFLAEPEDAEAS